MSQKSRECRENLVKRGLLLSNGPICRGQTGDYEIILVHNHLGRISKPAGLQAILPACTCFRCRNEPARRSLATTRDFQVHATSPAAKTATARRLRRGRRCTPLTSNVVRHVAAIGRGVALWVATHMQRFCQRFQGHQAETMSACKTFTKPLRRYGSACRWDRGREVLGTPHAGRPQKIFRSPIHWGIPVFAEWGDTARSPPQIKF